MNADRQPEIRSATAYAERVRERFSTGFLSELQPLHQWVVWKPEMMHGKLKKVPYDPATHRHASVKQADTWGTLDTTLNALTTGNYKGLGFVLTRNDPICGTDIDGCRDQETGEITPLAQEVVALLSSYTEISPSGTGLHILTLARLPGQGMKTAIELYDQGRFFTITTDHLPGTPSIIAARQAEIASLYLTYAAVQLPKGVESTRGGAGVARRRGSPSIGKTPDTGRPSTRSDEEVLERAMHAKNREQFVELWEGRWQDNTRYTSQGKPDASKADWQLVKYLLYWTNGNPQQTDRLFRRSALMRPKWDDNTNSGGSGHTYGQVTIHNAMK